MTTSRPRRPRWVAVFLAPLLAMGVTFGVFLTTAAPAEARVYYYVVNKSTVSTGYVRKAQVLASCQAVTSGTTCSISDSKSATRTIGLALDATRSFVAANLSISSSYTRTLTVTCNSPVMTAGQVFKAWPRGYLFQYRIKKIYVGGGSISPYLNAFDPRGIACGIG